MEVDTRSVTSDSEVESHSDSSTGSMIPSLDEFHRMASQKLCDLSSGSHDEHQSSAQGVASRPSPTSLGGLPVEVWTRIFKYFLSTERLIVVDSDVRGNRVSKLYAKWNLNQDEMVKSAMAIMLTNCDLSTTFVNCLPGRIKAVFTWGTHIRDGTSNDKITGLGSVDYDNLEEVEIRWIDDDFYRLECFTEAEINTELNEAKRAEMKRVVADYDEWVWQNERKKQLRRERTIRLAQTAHLDLEEEEIDDNDNIDDNEEEERDFPFAKVLQMMASKFPAVRSLTINLMDWFEETVLDGRSILPPLTTAEVLTPVVKALKLEELVVKGIETKYRGINYPDFKHLVQPGGRIGFEFCDWRMCKGSCFLHSEPGDVIERKFLPNFFLVFCHPEDVDAVAKRTRRKYERMERLDPGWARWRKFGTSRCAEVGDEICVWPDDHDPDVERDIVDGCWHYGVKNIDGKPAWTKHLWTEE